MKFLTVFKQRFRFDQSVLDSKTLNLFNRVITFSGYSIAWLCLFGHISSAVFQLVLALWLNAIVDRSRTREAFARFMEERMS